MAPLDDDRSGEALSDGSVGDHGNKGGNEDVPVLVVAPVAVPQGLAAPQDLAAMAPGNVQVNQPVHTHSVDPQHNVQTLVHSRNAPPKTAPQRAAYRW